MGEPEVWGGKQGRPALQLRCSHSDQKRGPRLRNPVNLANTSAYTIFSQCIILETNHQLLGLRRVIKAFEQHLALMVRIMLVAHHRSKWEKRERSVKGIKTRELLCICNE